MREREVSRACGDPMVTKGREVDTPPDEKASQPALHSRRGRLPHRPCRRNTRDVCGGGAPVPPGANSPGRMCRRQARVSWLRLSVTIRW